MATETEIKEYLNDCLTELDRARLSTWIDYLKETNAPDSNYVVHAEVKVRAGNFLVTNYPKAVLRFLKK